MTLKRYFGLSLVLGVICFALRQAVWSAAYDPVTQLTVNGRLMLMSNLFICLCALVVLLLPLIHWPRQAVAAPPYRSETPFRRILRLGAVVCSMAGGGLLLVESAGVRPLPLVTLIMGVLLIAQGVALLLLAVWADIDSKRYASLLLLPAFTACYWMVAFYHGYGACPNRETYLWPTVAGLVAAGAWLCYIGFAYERPRGTAFTLTALLSLLILPVALAAPLPLTFRLPLAGDLLWFWAALLSVRFAPAPAADKTPETDTSQQDREPIQEEDPHV